MRRFRKIALALGLAYILIVSMAYYFQEKLIFLPTQLPQDFAYSFSEPFEEIFLDANDGARLNALHFKTENPKGVILYFHGNAGDLSRWGTIASYFTQFQYDVLVMDYRTYGKSTGELSEAALYSDAVLFYNYLLERYEEEQIVIYGRSLGTGIAAYIGAKKNPQQLLLETPYYSITDVANRRFPFFPVRYLLKYKLPSHSYLLNVNCPVTILHGTHDRVVAQDSGKKLSEVKTEYPVTFVSIADAGHNNLIEYELYRKEVAKALE